MAGPLCKQILETEADLLLWQRFKFLSDQQSEASAKTSQTMKIYNPWIPLASYNIIHENLEILP